MAINRGIGANRTSYNEKQEIQTYVIGVLKSNTDIRNNILKKNIGKYDMYDEVLTPAIGEYYDIYANEENRYSPIGPNGLFGYTNNNSSEFGRFINNKYKRNEDEIVAYEIFNPNPITLAKWGGKYENYVKYISDTYGHELKFNNFLNSLLGENDIKYAMFNDRVGIVRDINVAYSLAGVMMTNINNFSGKDTPLGTFTNKMYALTLNNAAYFNSLRNTSYITPSLFSEYGNNLTNLNKLTDMFPISEETGRLSYEIGYGDFIKELTVNYSNFDEYNERISNKTDELRFNQLYYNNTNGVNTSEFIEKWNMFQPYAIATRSKGKSNFVQGIKNILIGDADSSRNVIVNIDNNIKLLEKNSLGGKSYNIFNEGDVDGVSSSTFDGNINHDDIFNPLESTNIDDNYKGLLDKTNDLFKKHKIGTLIGRFHSSIDTDKDSKTASLIQTAISEYGISHGRNLLKKGRDGSTQTGDDINGYDNPYCRVWTYHHQYSTIKDLIRPFVVGEGESERIYSIEELQNSQKFSRHTHGAKHLSDNTVLNSNGFVNITPTDNGISIKKCMFSIENLAWKDVLKTSKNISSEQIGPLGGRIMWFPPYNIKFTENTSVGWNGNDFIGRGEKIYSYINTERGGTLSFSLLIDHPSILDYWKNGKESTQENEDDILRYFAGCAPLELTDKTTEDEIDNKEEAITSEPKETNPNGESVVFYVYFPNNYSGINDLPATGNKPISSIVSSNEDKNIQKIVDSMTYIFCGSGVQKNGLINPWDVDLYEEDLYPGYEMVDGSGITIYDDPEIFNDVIIGKYGNWAYRIDNSYIDERLFEKGNYYDYSSYCLNSKLDKQPKDATYTFAEVFAAYYKDQNNGSDILKKAKNCGANEDRINSFNDIIFNNDVKISKINISGSASSHGTNKNNNELNKNRATTVKSWLKEIFGTNRLKNINWGDSGNDIQETKSDSQSDITAKLGRCARVEIIFENSKIDKLSDTNSFTTNTDATPTANTINENRKTVDTPVDNNSNKIITKKTVTNTAFMKDSRYENEAEFFTTLSINEPLIKSKIIDKVKYFDPAFHSITPEGFNSRLTFLHQCTRQGHTIDASDKNGFAKTAGNLAFGRPPVCVLRIGDFFYTRIIIESLNIDYDPLVWDMNPEGIGLQPMIANINLSFKFIGGSDLGGPIARLQNAVSFNYYANSSVYDDRADRVTYENPDSDYGTTTPTYNNIWIPENKK